MQPEVRTRKKPGFRIGFGFQIFRIFEFEFGLRSLKSEIQTRIQAWKSEKSEIQIQSENPFFFRVRTPTYNTFRKMCTYFLRVNADLVLNSRIYELE